ncbi:MAG: HEPN domain-containing protein [Ignavibacteria bacterium]|nr:HEPN domain-containing protein [Ignavibacteria bacterium]
MTLREEERSIIIQYRIKQAGQALDDADFLLENKRLSLAANRIYYALFYSISAIALKENFSTSKHKQLIGWFNKKYIKGTSNNSNSFATKAHRHKEFLVKLRAFVSSWQFLEVSLIQV